MQDAGKPDGDWIEYRRLVLAELQRLDRSVQKTERDLTEMLERVKHFEKTLIDIKAGLESAANDGDVKRLGKMLGEMIQKVSDVEVGFGNKFNEMEGFRGQLKGGWSAVIIGGFVVGWLITTVIAVVALFR